MQYAISTNMLVAFEGPIAAGKTTLAQLYSTHAKCPAVLEEFVGNEFLADFYADKDRWSFQMQLWFLLDRHEQLAKYGRSAAPLLVADYAFIKNEIFARFLLHNRDLRLFERAASALNTILVQPDLFVYLDANDTVLLGRIAGRGREYEKHINEKYLNDLRAAYESNLMSSTERQIVQFDTSTLDLNSKVELDAIFDAIDVHVSRISSQAEVPAAHRTP
jgi:deoxyguanosine kinase